MDNSNIFGANPAMSQFSPQMESSIQQVQKLMSTLDPNQNPQQMLQALMTQNPQFGNLAGLLSSTNGDIRALVTNLAKQQGVDLNALYQRFKAL